MSWYERNRDKHIANVMEYQRQHKEQHNESMKKWVEKNKEYYLAYQKQYRLEHPKPKKDKKQRLYREQNNITIQHGEFHPFR